MTITLRGLAAATPGVCQQGYDSVPVNAIGSPVAAGDPSVVSWTCKPNTSNTPWLGYLLSPQGNTTVVAIGGVLLLLLLLNGGKR
jgi:hypothetical protein